LSLRMAQLGGNQLKTLRCAKPITENLDVHIPLPNLDHLPFVLAADGSQILPDRHAAVYYGLINVSGFVLPYGQNSLPQITQACELIYGNQLENFSEARLALQRDIAERRMILDLGKTIPAPCIALVDGPLELWVERGQSGEEQELYQRSLEDYFTLLGNIYQAKIMLGGYIDRPESNYLVRLLEIGRAGEEELADIQHYHPFSGISDIDLFADLLKPGERSAIFSLQSHINMQFPPHSQIHFFYINVGRENQAWLGRVEIPAWVALEKELVDLVHATIVTQCQIMGGNAYPYALHRAHEIAVVRFDEKEQVTRWITTEMLRRGLPMGIVSHKQGLKNLPFRQPGKIKLGGKK
ncbi:MAG: DNA double-strand break repair nuclease NurA, partial [Anaerolineales bacterium]